jgi:hypothetical protein
MAHYPHYHDKVSDALQGTVGLFVIVLTIYGAFLEKPLTLLWHWLFPGKPLNS